jgi:hypothetical protein
MTINVEFEFSEIQEVKIEIVCHECGDELESIGIKNKYRYHILPCKKCLDKRYFEALEEIK